MNFLKALKCKHQKVTFIENLGGDGAERMNAQSVWKCDKCEKIIYSQYRNNDLINKLIKNRDIDTEDISDGYHTFGELYYHRMVLFSIICNQNNQESWKSKLHSDGSMFDDYFIVGINTTQGQFTYHYHIDHWDIFEIDELNKAPEWDGHTAKDITRLFDLTDNKVRKLSFKKR